MATAIPLIVAVLAWPDRARAEPITPRSDSEIIEVLPAVTGNRSEERRLRQQLAARPADVTLALAVATRDLERARVDGDPRFAGMALAALAPWERDASAPDAVLLMRATLQQYLHEFDPAVVTLRGLLARRGAQQAQAWLTLATIFRVQAKYAESDAACEEVARAGAALYASACAAENASLRGDVAAARATFAALLSQPGQAAQTRSWLLTSVAEMEERDGRAAAADRAFRETLKIDADSYAATSYADFLIAQRRPAEALVALRGQVRTDAVLLRLAIAGARAHAASAAADAAEMRARIALANERPGSQKFHGREQAMFALAIEGDARLALALARGDIEQQREALDVLVFTQAARASGDAAALAEAARLKRSIGLHDKRIDALL